MASRSALYQLKRANEQTADCFIWYTLAERLARRGYDSAWMADHATPRCPLCADSAHARAGSETKFREGVWFNEAICATRPSEHGCVDEAVRETVVSVYNATFDESIAELSFV
jgi:hypothetical protein